MRSDIDLDFSADDDDKQKQLPINQILPLLLMDGRAHCSTAEYSQSSLLLSTKPLGPAYVPTHFPRSNRVRQRSLFGLKPDLC